MLVLPAEPLLNCHRRRYLFFCLLLVQAVLMSVQVSVAQTTCEISQATYDSDLSFENQRSPIFVRLMGSRYVDLRRSERGLSCTGVPLVAFDGLRFRAAGEADDPGIYYFVPELARAFHLRLETAADLMLIGTVLLGSCIGLLGFMKTAQSATGRRIGVIAFLLLTILELIAGDVYVMNAAPAVACVPWILYFASRKHLTKGAMVTFVLMGLTSQLADFVRAQAGTGLIIFTLVALAGLYQMKPWSRLTLAALLLAGGAGVHMFCHQLYAQRNTFLAARFAGYEPEQRHVFWHAVYLGLGYVQNSDVPAYRDEVAIAKVQLLEPTAKYPSLEYEQVLKKETLALARRRPFLILESLLVKLAVVLLFCICAANVGLYAAIVSRKSIWCDLAFLGAVGFSALFGILVVPNPKYLLGLITFAALYGVYSIQHATEQQPPDPRIGWIGRLVRV